MMRSASGSARVADRAHRVGGEGQRLRVGQDAAFREHHGHIVAHERPLPSHEQPQDRARLAGIGLSREQNCTAFRVERRAVEQDRFRG